MKRFGNYEILSLLGKGGMAEVYRARVLSGPREGWQVALKRLSPALAKDPVYVEQFAGEADLSRLLDHPNIVKVLEVGVLQEIYFIVMELVDGRDLGQVVRRCREKNIQLPVDFGVFLTKTLLEALEHAHQAVGPSGKPLNVVHCDVSPSNLFISRTGEIKLGDFGVARGRLGGGDGSGPVGKPHYLSPEALNDDLTPASDLWAAAVTLYELVTLERPFQGETPDEVFEKVRARDFVSVSERRPEARPELAIVFERAFAEDLSERFQTAGEFAQALAPLYDELVGTPLAIASVVRGLFGATSSAPA